MSPFYEQHRQRAIELMKYKLYFEVSFVAITNDILVEIAESTIWRWIQPKHLDTNKINKIEREKTTRHRSSNVQFVQYANTRRNIVHIEHIAEPCILFWCVAILVCNSDNSHFSWPSLAVRFYDKYRMAD